MREVGARTTRRRFLGLVLAASSVGIVVAPSALAQDEATTSGAEDQVVLTGELLVPDGATVGTAVIFNGDATIEGTATESVVVFNGDVEISGTVGDDVVGPRGLGEVALPGAGHERARSRYGGCRPHRRVTGIGRG